MTTNATSPERLLDTAEAAKFLNMGKRTVQELAAERKLTQIKIGRSVRYDLADLRIFIESQKIKASGWKKSNATPASNA